MRSFTELPAGTLYLITALLLGTFGLIALLAWRFYLRHADQQTLQTVHNPVESLHATLRHRISLIDRWGASLTAALVIYAIALLSWLTYESISAIAQFFQRLLSLL